MLQRSRHKNVASNEFSARAALQLHHVVRAVCARLTRERLGRHAWHSCFQRTLAKDRPGIESVQPLSVPQLVLELIEVLASNSDRSSYSCEFTFGWLDLRCLGQSWTTEGERTQGAVQAPVFASPPAVREYAFQHTQVGVQATVWPCRNLSAVRATRARQLVIQRLDAW